MVTSGSNTDSDEKKDTVPELKAIKKVDKGKKPMEDKMERRSTRLSKISLQAQVDLITHKAKGIVIDEAKKPQTGTTASSKTGRRKKFENVVRSRYSLRTGEKGMAVDLDDRKRKGKEKKTDETALEKMRKRAKRETLNVARKRKGKETETREFSDLEADDPEEVCKRIRKERNKDDDDDGPDKDGAGSAGAYSTRSSTRNMMVKSN